MNISLAGIEKSPRKFRASALAAPYLEQPEVFPGDLSVWALLGKEGEFLHLDLTVSVSGHFICDRCGQPFNRLHEVQEDFYFAIAGKSAARRDPEMPVIPRGAVELDISQEIRDVVLLNLPAQIVCREDCQGLCSRCGADLNVESCHCPPENLDPRWQGLVKLKNNQDQNT